MGTPGCPWLSRLALFADPSCGEEHRVLGPGWNLRDALPGYVNPSAAR
jgi:hypothetical protein